MHGSNPHDTDLGQPKSTAGSKGFGRRVSTVGKRRVSASRDGHRPNGADVSWSVFNRRPTRLGRATRGGLAKKEKKTCRKESVSCTVGHWKWGKGKKRVQKKKRLRALVGRNKCMGPQNHHQSEKNACSKRRRSPRWHRPRAACSNERAMASSWRLQLLWVPHDR